VNDEDKKQLINLLNDIQLKLTSSTVMNGGFEKLFEKVNKIETTQEKIITDINEIRGEIYDPNSGLYSKIKNCESSNLEKVHNLEKEFFELKYENKYVKNDLSKIKDIDNTLNEFNKIKDNYSKFTWMLIAAILSNVFWIARNFVH